MRFWHNLQTAAGMGGAFHWAVLGFVVAALVLFRFVPAQRARIRTAVLLFACAFAGLLVAAALLSYGGAPANTIYSWIRWPALFIESVAITNLASVIIFDLALPAARLRPPRIMRDLLLAATYLVIAITLLSRSGVNLAGIVVTSAVITGVVGISLQDTLGNLMGGIVLQMGHVIRVGDWVRIDGEEGQVKEISWWQTSIETRAWDTIVIPNRVLTKGHVTLLGQRIGAPQQHRQSISFNVDFRYAPTDVIDAVEKALRAEPLPNVAREPAPFCLVMDFKDSYLSYAVWYWLTDLLRPGVVDSLVRSRIYFALRRANIPLSIPARSLFITQEDEMRRERKQSEELERRIAALQSIDLFHTLTDDEQRELAGRLHVAPFGRGEAMIRQGAQGHSLYLITSGEAEVRVTAEDAAVSKTVATLHAGDFFGEMGLMTGEPRSATVVATTNVECYRLDQEAFMDILRRRPKIAEDISHMLAHRRHELDAAREGLNEETMRLHMRGTEHDLLHRIRRFFALDGHNGAHS